MNKTRCIQIFLITLVTFIFGGCSSSSFSIPEHPNFTVIDSSEVQRSTTDGYLKQDGQIIPAALIYSYYAPNQPESIFVVIDGITIAGQSFRVNGKIASSWTRGTGIIYRYNYPEDSLWMKTTFKRGRIISIDEYEDGKLIRTRNIDFGRVQESAFDKAYGKVAKFFDPNASVFDIRDFESEGVDPSWGEIGEGYLGLVELAVEIPIVILKLPFEILGSLFGGEE